MALELPLAEPPWPQSLSPLKEVDDLLRCGICFDYFSIAMIIPQCSHNYCSLCIRKFLSYKTQCPTCSVATSESDLKNNRTLDELVKSFQSARQQLVQLLSGSSLLPSLLACSRPSAGSSHVESAGAEVPAVASIVKKEEVCTPPKAGGLAAAQHQGLQPEGQPKLHSSSAELRAKASQEAAPGSPEGSKGHEKPSTSAVKAAKKVECPVCEVAVPEQYINQHLDSCLTRDEKKDSLRSSGHKRKPLAKVVYNLLSERDLKRKLKAQGLSARGSRQQLIRRHQEFTHMYNAQCDSLHPKPVAEIVRELEKNEKIRLQLELSKPTDNSLTFTKDQTEEEIDEIHSGYRSKHRKEFQLLVDQVSKRWKRGGKRTAESALDTAERAPGKEDAARELPAGTGHREEHQAAAGPGKAQTLQRETPDGRSEPCSLEEVQRSASPELSPSSGSTSSSSSDILRDPQEPETCSACTDSSFLALGGNKRKSHQSHTPKSKRKKS
ncbi:E3 ubiquitin-protein ligase RAD18 isoform X2 [Pogoniulus pusillus]|uniref:E3 ubiquitin-protein ligase RAD18 isoform X2 n=1 Tax=Pogoniulus pusillus TaxID=488313 RepID=UPI0030B970BE